MNEPIARRIKNALVRHDYLVWLGADEIAAGQDWAEATMDAMSMTARSGFAVVLIGERTADSPWVKRGILSLNSLGGMIIPVLIGDATIGDRGTLGYVLACLQSIRISENPTDDELEQLVKTFESQIEF